MLLLMLLYHVFVESIGSWTPPLSGTLLSHLILVRRDTILLPPPLSPESPSTIRTWFCMLMGWIELTELFATSCTPPVSTFTVL